MGLACFVSILSLMLQKRINRNTLNMPFLADHLMIRQKYITYIYQSPNNSSSVYIKHEFGRIYWFRTAQLCTLSLPKLLAQTKLLL
jgi:hypothetical protein